MSKKENNNNPSIFSKVIEAGEAILDAQIHKAKNTITMNKNVDEDFFYSKAVTEEPTYSIHSSGWKEKPTRLQNSHLKQMSIKNTVAAAIIQTRQNQIANHSKLVESEKEKGFMIKLRNERELIEEIKIKLREEKEKTGNLDGIEEDDEITKAETPDTIDSNINPEEDDSAAEAQQNQDDKQKDDDEVEDFDWELERKAKEIVRKKFEKEKKVVEDYILNCGKVENRPFKTKIWNFDSALRALTRDSLTYDLYAIETVPDQVGKPHHWFPVDGGTVKYASVDLNKYKDNTHTANHLDILYPESDLKTKELENTLKLDEDLLEKNAYKWVQVVRGRIERAFTDDELKVGIRNVTTDIYNNGYGLSELELSVSLITGHINAEYYNQAYFTQGFSAKGILHIKAAINRRKLESVRQQWQHMIRGARNSFQTPIFAGVDEVQWIPLTQNHDDIGFEGWMRYLIKMICAIYQIDPHEIGIGFKDEGQGAGGISGDNTKEKLKQSKDKGFIPLVRHLEAFINENIIKPFDDRFILCFTGITEESQQESLERQEKEVKFKKTVNEIRAEDGLPPIPGMDGIILSQEFLQWYSQFSKEAQELQQQNMQMQQDMMNEQNAPEDFDEESMYHENNLEDTILNPEEESDPIAKAAKSLIKSKRKRKKRPLKIEYYRTE